MVSSLQVITTALIAIASIRDLDALSTRDPLLGRRSTLQKTAGVAITSFFGGSTLLPNGADAAVTSIASRLDNQILTMPSPSRPSELNGVDNLYYPSFMAGEWSVTQTLVDASTPLGLKYVGGPNGVEDIAKATMDEVRKKLNEPVALRLRYRPTKWGVAEDRLFNAKQRLDAFAGKSVVAGVDYNNVGGSNRPSVLSMGGTEEDPLQTTFIRFKGPAAQKTFVVSHGAEKISDTQWAGYELDRAIFALTNQSTAPPLTTDSEIIWMFEKVDDDTVKAKLRIAGYLNAQSDTLYFDARNRAVSLQDYTLEMKRISSA